MAQVLKEEQRKKIVMSAKNEFFKNGIANASMREISKNAGTPVGNIYRYFKNKQDLVEAVLSPLLTKLNDYDFNSLNEESLLNGEAISKFLANWVDNIVELQSAYPTEMNIIVDDEQINLNYQKSLTQLITSIVFMIKSEATKDDETLQILSKMIAKSIFAGIREGVGLKYNSNIDKEAFRKIMHTYMKNTFIMLENID